MVTWDLRQDRREAAASLGKGEAFFLTPKEISGRQE